jgi:uncharacterized damage-inducible protein DinB
MTSIDLLTEFTREARVTRTHLARIPEDRLDWRPHQKSYTARELASHLVDCVQWASAIFGADEYDVDPSTYRPYRAATVAALLEDFDRAVEAGGNALQTALSGAARSTADQPWRLKVAGRVRFERTRADALRDFTLSHQIHHRGQLSVYLRLLEVPVPGSYGPTADER